MLQAKMGEGTSSSFVASDIKDVFDEQIYVSHSILLN